MRAMRLIHERPTVSERRIAMLVCGDDALAARGLVRELVEAGWVEGTLQGLVLTEEGEAQVLGTVEPEPPSPAQGDEEERAERVRRQEAEASKRYRDRLAARIEQGAVTGPPPKGHPCRAAWHDLAAHPWSTADDVRRRTGIKTAAGHCKLLHAQGYLIRHRADANGLPQYATRRPPCGPDAEEQLGDGSASMAESVAAVTGILNELTAALKGAR